MLRIILAILVLFLLIGAIKKWLAMFSEADRKKSRGKLVKCQYCGIYITEESAVSMGKHYFCSTDHRLKGRE